MPAQGARVGFVDLAEAEGKALADELNGAGGSVAFRACDITDIAAYRQAIAEIEARHGPTLALVNNAANDTRHDWREVTPDYFDGRVAVNLRHAFFAIQAIAPGMIAAGKGSIVNFGSIGWMNASGGYPVYAASKAAVHGMTRSFARDLGKHGIRVNTLVPGWVMTKRQLELWVDDAANAEIDKAQCLTGPGACPTTSPAWRCSSPPTIPGCARRRTSSSTVAGCRVLALGSAYSTIENRYSVTCE